MGEFKAIKTDNNKDMCNAMDWLTAMSNDRNKTNITVSKLHVRCIAHVVNLSAKECLDDVHENIDQTGSLVNAIRSSVQRIEIYESTKRTRCLGWSTYLGCTYKLFIDF